MILIIENIVLSWQKLLFLMVLNSRSQLLRLTILVFAAVAVTLAMAASVFAQSVPMFKAPPTGRSFGQLTEWAAGRWRLAEHMSTLGGQASLSKRQSDDGVRPVPVQQQAPLLSSISGYMDFHVNNVEHRDATVDFHRFVLLFTHSFSDRIRFVSELELEHAFVEGLEEAGELELEQAYIDFLVTRELNFRAGMLLVPVGIINERHEPPVYHGVERPFVDTFIVPSTWFEGGAGVHGELGRGVRYRAYVIAPLDASGFSADEGIRGGRQRGSVGSGGH